MIFGRGNDVAEGQRRNLAPSPVLIPYFENKARKPPWLVFSTGFFILLLFPLVGFGLAVGCGGGGGPLGGLEFGKNSLQMGLPMLPHGQRDLGAVPQIHLIP